MKKAILLFLTALMAIGAMAQKDIKKLERKANAGDTFAMCMLAYYYENGKWGLDQNYEEAFKWYKKAAEQGFALSMNELAYCYYFGRGVDQSYEQAYNILKGIAEEDKPGYCMQLLAKCYRFGRGCQKDLEEAKKWEKKAFEAGDDDALKARQLREQMVK